jgi:hypothetical protein
MNYAERVIELPCDEHAPRHYDDGFYDARFEAAEIAAEADAEIERLRSALSGLVSDLNDRAVGGFVDCGASVWIAANEALAPDAPA